MEKETLAQISDKEHILQRVHFYRKLSVIKLGFIFSSIKGLTDSYLFKIQALFHDFSPTQWI